MTVLIIEDDEDIRTVARISLTRIGGMRVREAGSGTEGLFSAIGDPPDLILLDVMMPGMDGPATLASLRANAATAHIPVIFLTAKAMAPEIVRLRSLGAVAVLTKPFDPATLPDQIKALL